MRVKLLMSSLVVALVIALGVCPGLASAADDEGADLAASSADMTAQAKSTLYNYLLVTEGGYYPVVPWTGSPVEPAYTIQDKEGNIIALTRGVDYKLTYTTNREMTKYFDTVVDEGVYRAYAEGMGNYQGRTASGTSDLFCVAKPENDFTRATVSGANTYVYTGQSMQNALSYSFTLDGKQLTNGTADFPKYTGADFYLFYTKGGWDGSGEVGTHKVEAIAWGCLGGGSLMGMQTLEYTVIDGSTDVFPEGTMHRLYNPNSYEHFYTRDFSEYCTVARAGWRDEGTGWISPDGEDKPVYRLYNPNNGGEHHYTMDPDERDMLVKAGWSDEGFGWNSADEETGVPVYREYNSHEIVNNHNYTTNKAEHDYLISLGWTDEKIAFYATSAS